MYAAILGRQAALGIAELEKLYGDENVRWLSDASALVDTSHFSLERLGGTIKAGRVVMQLPRGDWRQASSAVVNNYTRAWQNTEGKITLGISAYGFAVSPREVQKTGLILKQKLKTAPMSLRLVPNAEPALSTATSHHNKLGLSPNKIELLVVRAQDGKIVIAESTGAQNITAYARRDQERPKRDAFVGMLPPKLAQIMINLATPTLGELADTETGHKQKSLRLLDPFCGTGVILQEAALMGYRVYGTDLSDKMIDYSQKNLEWLAATHHVAVDATLHQGDAMTTKWPRPIDAVACETYLGQPFSAPPSPPKLAEVRKNCNHITSTFLKNIAGQLTAGTPLCVGIPAWRSADGTFTHLPLLGQLEQFSFTRHTFKNANANDLLYYREGQVVARELLVLAKK
jgi:tRNA G10  N-methylase Trm11